MPSLQDHANTNREPKDTARTALLTAITAQVAAVQKSATPTAAAAALKDLAQAYSAIVHLPKG